MKTCLENLECTDQNTIFDQSSATKYEKGYLQMKNTKWFLNNFNYKSTDIFIYRINITYILLLDNIL